MFSLHTYDDPDSRDQTSDCETETASIKQRKEQSGKSTVRGQNSQHFQKVTRQLPLFRVVFVSSTTHACECLVVDDKVANSSEVF